RLSQHPISSTTSRPSRCPAVTTKRGVAGLADLTPAARHMGENGLRALAASPPLNAADASSVARRTGTLTRKAPPKRAEVNPQRACRPAPEPNTRNDTRENGLRRWTASHRLTAEPSFWLLCRKSDAARMKKPRQSAAGLSGDEHRGGLPVVPARILV